MNEDRLLAMMETMMVSADRSMGGMREELERSITGMRAELKSGLDTLEAKLDVGFEEIRHDMKGIADGVSFLMERVEVIDVDRLYMETRVLKIEAELSTIKQRQKTA